MSRISYAGKLCGMPVFGNEECFVVHKQNCVLKIRNLIKKNKKLNLTFHVKKRFM